MMEACGIDVFKTARRHGFEIDTRKETYGRWHYFALVLIELAAIGRSVGAAKRGWDFTLNYLRIKNTLLTFVWIC